MAATQLRSKQRELVEEPAPIVDSIGAFGWLCLGAIAVVAVLLVAVFEPNRRSDRCDDRSAITRRRPGLTRRGESESVLGGQNLR
jgi:hypothetical protein